MFGRRVQTGRVKLLSCVFAIGALVVGAGACSSDDNGGGGTAVDTITVTLPTTAAPIPVDGQPCGPTSLQVTLGQTEGAMGNQYTPIVFTNIGTVSCTLDGYPDVSFVDDGGTGVGAPAATTGGPAQTVTLAVGAQAHATMDYHDPGLFGDCAPAPTASVMILPPGHPTALTIPFPSSLCTTPTPEPELTIEAITPGAMS